MTAALNPFIAAAYADIVRAIADDLTRLADLLAIARQQTAPVAAPQCAGPPFDAFPIEDLDTYPREPEPTGPSPLPAAVEGHAYGHAGRLAHLGGQL